MINKSQLKLIMKDKFKIIDNPLVESVFMVADQDNEGAVDVRVLCTVIAIHLPYGTIDSRLSLVFEILRNRSI